MSIFRREPRITKMARQLAAIESGLNILEGSCRVPSPIETEAMAYIRTRLPLIVERCAHLEPEIWRRVETWRNTPYTPWQKIARSLLALIAYWLFGTFALYSSFLWMLQSFFPKHWYVIALSTGISLIAVTYVAINERTRK